MSERVEPEVVPPDQDKPAVPENPISDPAGLIRIGTMIQALRDEVRGVDLDEATRERLTGIYRRSVEAIRESLSPELHSDQPFFHDCPFVD